MFLICDFILYFHIFSPFLPMSIIISINTQIKNTGAGSEALKS